MYTKASDVNWIMYNDQTYDTIEERDKEKATDHESDGKGGTYAHMKGDLAWDSATGFWLVHSVPGFPLSHKVKFANYPLPNWVYLRAQAVYGQWFYCATLPTSAFNDIGKLLQYDYPYVYDSHMTSKMKKQLPDLAAVLEGTYIKGSYNITLTSDSGRKYIAFGKNYATNSDLYEDFVAPGLNTGLKTETWFVCCYLYAGLSLNILLQVWRDVWVPLHAFVLQRRSHHWSFQPTKGSINICLWCRKRVESFVCQQLVR